MHQSFINYRGYRYATVGTVAVIATIAAYTMDNPRVPPNGGTILGYVLGTVAAVLVIFLALFGVRKRAFHSSIGTATGWVSAHVYLGLAALVIATFHCGMHFGWNVHTLAYVLMSIVTFSGIWGVYAYLRYPGVMMRQRGSLRRKEMLTAISELDKQAVELAMSAAQGVQSLVAESIRRTDLGSNRLWSQLRAQDHSTLLIGGESPQRPALLIPNPGHKALVERIAQYRLVTRDPAMLTRMQSLLEVCGRKAVILERMRNEVQHAALLRIWLWLHVPICCALLAALAIHIISVFYYW